jgi:predicted transcriptional regulator
LTEAVLTPDEKSILVLIKDYLNQNRVFRLPAIVSYISSRNAQLSAPLGYAEVNKILWSLIKKRIVVPGSKLSQDTILDNPTRGQIYDFVTKNPGSYYREIMKNLDIGSNEVIWHIDILLKFGFIRYAEIEDRKIFFNAAVRNDYDTEIYFLGDKKINEIIQYLVQNIEGSTRTQISNDLSMHYNTVVKNLEKLEKIELIIRSDEYDTAFYRLNFEKFKEILDGIESVKTI